MYAYNIQYDSVHIRIYIYIYTYVRIIMSMQSVLKVLRDHLLCLS